MFVIFLYALAPLIAMLYKAADYWNIFDHLSGRSRAKDALERLRSPKGYPDVFIYNDEQDRLLFGALYQRVRKNTKVKKFNQIIEELGVPPNLFATAGNPFYVDGVSPDMKEETRFYSDTHPVLAAFGPTRDGEQSIGKALAVCTLGEIDKWIEKEKKNREFWLGVIVVTIISVASVIWRLQSEGKI